MARALVRVTDAQWARIQPYLPKSVRSPRGGRPRADDRACLEGILWVLRTGARWRDLPEAYPSPATCWRRLGAWEDADVWEDLWRAFLSELDQQGLIGWEECFMDGTFAPAKKGALVSAKHGKVRGQSLWYWLSARVYLSEFASMLPRWPRSRSRSGRSPRSGSHAVDRADPSKSQYD